MPSWRLLPMGSGAQTTHQRRVDGFWVEARSPALSLCRFLPKRQGSPYLFTCVICLSFFPPKPQGGYFFSFDSVVPFPDFFTWTFSIEL